ncbi:hypothetical protein I4F81_007302 [Pyropia yezoensis]|uniref:Uncharacterized protein n=1 Tax=Pyropia yezoensis TaxID=2788 RepID=A0ACC3C471_PYRYE|nr:hypothetical protein I4F81_007302 [Neopyropia yezoensis]
MPRHSKNNSDGAHFTYSERATMATTVGSTRSRLGGDSLRPYHHCCLSLAPARDPVLTPGGYLYDKPAILGALLAQRRAARAARAAAADAAAADAAAAEERGAASRDAAVAAFVDAGTPIVAATAAASAGVAAGASGAGAGAGGSGGAVGAVVGTRKEGLGPPPSNFWMPARAPIAAAAPAAAADPRTRCPVSGAALRAKQLIACVRRFVVKTKTDPTTGERLRVPAGVVPIRAGGTAFAASGGEAKVASRYAPAARG